MSLCVCVCVGGGGGVYNYACMFFIGVFYVHFISFLCTLHLYKEVPEFYLCYFSSHCNYMEFYCIILYIFFRGISDQHIMKKSKDCGFLRGKTCNSTKLYVTLIART